jgi:hypothetical protein
MEHFYGPRDTEDEDIQPGSAQCKVKSYEPPPTVKVTKSIEHTEDPMGIHDEVIETKITRHNDTVYCHSVSKIYLIGEKVPRSIGISHSKWYKSKLYHIDILGK